MKVLSSRFLVSTICAAALLGGCSSSSSPTNDGLQNDPTKTETDNEVDPDTGNPPVPGEEILVPNVAAGSELERLIAGIRRQVSLTLLNLNDQLASGLALSDQQETCVGPYDPAIGEQLLAIDCDQALATGNVRVYVGEAAFYDTPDCHASIFNGNTDDCQLQRAGITLPDLWRTLEGQKRPELIYAGSELSYALTDTMLHIESSETALNGVFKCDLDLSSGTSSTPLVGTSCLETIKETADYLDEVVAE